MVKWSDCALSDWVQRDDKQNLFRSLKKMYCGKKDYLDAQHHRYLSTQWSSFVACTLHWGAGRSIGALLSTSWSCLSLMMVQHTCCTLRMLPRITLAAWLNARFSQSKSYIIPIHPTLKVLCTAIQKYCQHCPSGKKTSAFYLTPLKKPKGDIWFGTTPIGHNTLSKTVYVMQQELVVLKQTTLCESLVLQDFSKVQSGWAADHGKNWPSQHQWHMHLQVSF